MASLFVRRVDQLDANSLDDELLDLLNVQYRKAFKYIPNSIWMRFGPEFDVLFKFLFKYMPLHCFGCTFGQNLFHLQYRQCPTYQPVATNKLQLLALASVGFPWIFERFLIKFLKKLPNKGLSETLLNVSQTLEVKLGVLYQILTLLNFCDFLQRSKYPSVMERCLSIRPQYTEAQSIKSIQNDNVDRELVWHGMSEFLAFTLPLINLHKMKGFFKRYCMPKYYKNSYKRYFIQSDLCSICGSIPNFPHVIGCSHVYCYYCITSNIMADPFYICLDCDIKADGLKSVKPLPINTV